MEKQKIYGNKAEAKQRNQNKKHTDDKKAKFSWWKTKQVRGQEAGYWWGVCWTETQHQQETCQEYCREKRKHGADPNHGITFTMGLLLRTLFVEISNRPIQISGPESSRPSCILSSIVPSCLYPVPDCLVWSESCPRSSRPVCVRSQIFPSCLSSFSDRPVLSVSCPRASCLV